MSEILVKTLTRHRESTDKFYMKDWTAFDVCQIMPDGYFTKNKHLGSKRMGIVLCVDAKIPQDYAGGSVDNPLWAKENDGYTSSILQRTQKIIDLTTILTNKQLKDCFNHELLINPITITKSYLDLFIDRSERTELHEYDKSGSFASGTVDVGPNGDADANTFLEFESNIANLTGVLTGETDEGSWNETAQIQLAGFTTSAANYLEFKATGDGRHAAGKWDSTAHYIEISSGTDVACVDNRASYFSITGMQLSMNADANKGYNTLVPAANYQKIEKCVIKLGSNLDGMLVALNDVDTIVDVISNVLYQDGTLHASSEGIRCAPALLNLYNNIIYNFGKGLDINGGTTINVKNNAIFGCNNDIEDSVGATYDYNATDDGDGANAIAPLGADWANEFPNYATYDFAIDNGGNCYHGSEITQTDDAKVPSDDIIGTARNTGAGEQTSVGAFEYVAAGATLTFYTKTDSQFNTPAMILNNSRTLKSLMAAQYTTNEIILNNNRALNSFVSAQFVTADIALLKALKMYSRIDSEFTTSDIIAAIGRAMKTSVNTAFSTESIILAVQRSLYSKPSTQFITSDIDVIISGLIEFYSKADCAFSTSDIDLTVSGIIEFFSRADCAFSTSDVMLAVQRALATKAASAFTTGDIELSVGILPLEFYTKVDCAFNTSDIVLLLTRALNSKITAEYVTADIALKALLRFYGKADCIFTTSDINLITDALESVLNTSAISITKERAFTSITTDRSTESITKNRQVFNQAT